MARVKGGVTAHAKHKRVLAATKGFKHGRKNIFRLAHQALVRAGSYSYRDRRVKKRMFRRQWIVTLNAAARQHDLTYRELIHRLTAPNQELDRKVLADLAENHPAEFAELVQKISK